MSIILKPTKTLGFSYVNMSKTKASTWVGVPQINANEDLGSGDVFSQQVTFTTGKTVGKCEKNIHGNKTLNLESHGGLLQIFPFNRVIVGFHVGFRGSIGFDLNMTLPETNIFAPENGWLEYVGIPVSFWDGLLSGANC